VRVRAAITNARTAPATFPIVSAKIGPTGTAEAGKHVLLVAEVAGPKPGANGLSGAGALLALARSYKELVDQGALIPPERTIEFLFVPDVHGACAYLSTHRDDLDNMLAVIHLGVVGTDTDTGPGKGRPLQIADGGWLVNSYLPYMALTFARYVAQSDLVDVAGSGAPMTAAVHSRGPLTAQTAFYAAPAHRPTVSLSFFPDVITNTNLDTPDTLDPTALKRTMYIALGTAYAIATPRQQEIAQFGPLVSYYVNRDTAGAFGIFSSIVATTPKDQLAWAYYRCEAIMGENDIRVQETLDSIRDLAPPGAEDSASTFSSKGHTAYSDRARAVEGLYHQRCDAQKLGISTKNFTKDNARLRRETPFMLWNGPVTTELLQRRAPEALPVPEGIDVPALFGFINGTRRLPEIWSEHEATKWIGLPYPLPRDKRIAIPAPAKHDETIAFMRRCAKAGVIRIEKSDRPQ